VDAESQPAPATRRDRVLDAVAAFMPEGRERLVGALAGVAMAITDTVFMLSVGIAFEMNGRDVTWLVASFFGSSLAIFGYFVGSLVEARRRDQRAAAVIRAQAHTIGAARARLAQTEKLAALGQLGAAIAHEVRNPLAVIRSAAQGLGETLSADDDDGRRACAFITAEIDRLSNVVTKLLAFARPPRLAPRPVEVRAVVDRALLVAESELAAKRVAVRRSDADPGAVVEADFDLLCQTVLGLVQNAVEAMPGGGEIVVETRRVDDGVEVAVADSGSGVPPDLRERVFEPFFTTRGSGTGLGLAVARQIVEAHGGTLDVGERPGGGARFVMHLRSAGRGVLAA
jgi:two-component system, NtrC family, sensor histidine kinase HydH